MKSVCFSLAALTVLVALMAAMPAFAQQADDTMTDDHIARIKSNCQDALGTLGRIHANDAPEYVNRNQTYFSISDKMMARLNSRLTLNRYDATQLIKTASDFDTALAKFRSSYKQYDDMMTDLLRIDCVKQPVTFYDSVNDARQQRSKVQEAVQQLKNLIEQYQQGVQSFKAQHFEQQNGNRP